jgi:hypothetical protein
MKNTNSQTITDSGRATREHRSASLVRFADRWDRVVRSELQRMAQNIWPNEPWMGFMPVHPYRLRKQLTRARAVWWIERDISPFDRFQCAAYRVELSMKDQDQASWIVRSGTATYPLASMSAGELKSALLRASEDVPLIIHRKFGPALDP